MLGDILLNYPLPLPQVFLVKTDGTILGKVEGRSGIAASKFGRRKKLITHTQLFKLGGISEMEFSIPFQIEINHLLVRNPIIDLVRIGYYLQVLFNGTEEFYIITDITNSMDDQKDIKLVKSKSLGYELIYRQIHDWNVISQNLSSLLNGGVSLDSLGDSFVFSGILQETLWTLDPSYDVTFDTMYRKFSFSQVTVLDALNQIALAMGAVLSFDTINRRINFQQLINIGQNRGFKISYKNYLRSVSNENNGDDLVTRFRPIGASGLTISSVNSNGMEFIDNFDWFLYPFERDNSRNVIQSSYYFSNPLSHALLDYQALLALHSGDYTTLLASLTAEEIILTSKNNDMATLTTTLKSLNAQLDIAQSTGQPTATILSQISAQNVLIASKQTEINTATANITTTNNSIAALQVTLSTSSNFSDAEVYELSKYVRQKDWTDNSITDAASLLSQGLLEFQKVNVPSITVKVDLINLFEVIESQRDFDKLNLGDIIEIEYDVISTSVSARIAEISFDHQASNLTLTISNFSNLKRDDEKLFAMLYSGNSANSSLSVNTDRWNGIDQISTQVNAIYDTGIAANLININSGVGSTTLLDARGFTSTSSTSSANFIRINNGSMIFSSTSGLTANIAIDSTGIYANKLVGQMIYSSTLSVTNTAGNFSVNGSGCTISDMTLSITRSDLNSRILLDPTNGIKIQALSGGAYVDKFYADSSGNIFANTLTLATPSITNGAATGMTLKIGSGSSIFTADTNGIYLGSSVFSSSPFRVTPAGAAVMSNVQINGGSISWGSINSDPTIATAQGTANTAQTNASTAQGTANNAQTIAQQIAAGTYSGGTFISGTQIYSPSINSPIITGGVLQTANSGSRMEVVASGINAYDGNNVKRLSILKNYSTNLPAFVLYDLNGVESGRFVSNYANRCDVVGYGSSSITLANDTIINGNNVTIQTWGGNFQMSNGDIIATQTWVQANAVAKLG